MEITWAMIGSAVAGVVGGLLAALLAISAYQIRHWATDRARKSEILALATEMDALRDTFKRFQAREGMRAHRDGVTAAKAAQNEAQAILNDATAAPKPARKGAPFPFNIRGGRGLGN
jgi:hypothetical protein